MEYKYDLAISLCDEDSELGWKICNELGTSNKIFFYKKDVDDLVFHNGNNVFGDVFAKDARFILVLFRDKYGQSDWTAIEYNIIAERFKKTIRSKNPPILFCKLDNSPNPNWLSETYIYSKYTSDSDLPNLIRQIRKQILDNGGLSFPKTTDETLESHFKSKNYEESYEQRMYLDRELANKSEDEALIVTSKLYERFKESAVKLNLKFDQDGSVRNSQLPSIRIILEDVLLIARYEKTSMNSIKESDLYIELFTVRNKQIICGGMFSSCYNEKITIQKFNLQFYITMNNTFGWRNDDKKFFSTQVLIEIVFNSAAKYFISKKPTANIQLDANR